MRVVFSYLGPFFSASRWRASFQENKTRGGFYPLGFFCSQTLIPLSLALRAAHLDLRGLETPPTSSSASFSLSAGAAERVGAEAVSVAFLSRCVSSHDSASSQRGVRRSQLVCSPVRVGVETRPIGLRLRIQRTLRVPCRIRTLFRDCFTVTDISAQ